VGVFAFGVLAACSGWALLRGGVFAYHNHHRMEVYSPELVVMGVVLMMLALVLDSLVAAMLKRSKRNG
jgi:hypothetical protein